jgi:putative spermidine/putrescine transport system substrate-binding protein
MSDEKTPRTPGLSRRRFLTTTAALGVTAGAAGLGAPGILKRAYADAPSKPDEIIVRAWGGAWLDAIKAGVSEPFTEMTGIKVRHDLTEDNEIQPKIWSAVQQNRIPPLHVNWDTTTNATKSALRGVTVDLSDLENLDGLLPTAEPLGVDGWPIVNVYSYVYVLAYREEAFPDGAPDSWDVLLDPKYKGRVALYDDGIGFTPVAVMLGGGSMSDIPQNMQPAWDYYEKLKQQQPLLGEDPDFTSWFQQGEIDLACTIITNARAAKQKGIAVDWTVPKEGAKVDTDSLWVPQQLPENETYWAKQYVNFALSGKAQQKWCNGLGLPPVRPGLTPPEDMQGDPAYPTEKADYKRLIRVPNDVLVRHQKDWFARFNEIMQA